MSGYYLNAIPASGKWEIHGAGRFFRIMRTGGLVAVGVYRNGSLIATVENVQGGLWRRGEFDKLIVRNQIAAANVVEVVTDDDEMGYDSFSIAGQQGAYTQAAATVTNVSGQLLAANSNRRVLLIQNNGTGDIYLNLAGAAATVGNGIKLGPGQSYEASGYCPSAAIMAIGSIASNPNVVVVEG
jgi:hypothetical protein